ncbi:MAG: metal ABC transporter solute-binding protein, Zn/Mn family [Spirochaetota bacterium]
MSKTILAAFLVLMVTGCGVESGDENSGDEAAQVVTTTFTVLSDFASQVAGDRLDVRTLTPAGAEIHEYELVPRNFVDIEEADLVLYNGYDIEQWISQVRETAQDDVRVIPVAEETGFTTIPIQLGEYEGVSDPHLWMNPRAAISYVEVIRDAFIELDPDGEAIYEENAEEYIAELETLEDDLQNVFADLPEEQRLLVTTEMAFLYFADAFDFDHEGIRGTNHEEDGTPDLVARVIDLVEERQPRAVFWESTISDRYMRSVADDTGANVAGPLYVDSVAVENESATDYVGLMRENARVIMEHLGE